MSKAIRIADNLYRIPTLGFFINSYALINDDGSVTLVDCGLKKAPAKIVAGLKSLGKDPKDVQSIILTHAHDDHIGGAAEMIKNTNVQRVAMHESDAGYAEAGKSPKPDLSSTSGRFLARMPQGGHEPFHVTQLLKDGDILLGAGELQVIHTPGHTEGHISLLHKRTGTLMTGDSIFNMTSRISWSLSGFCVDYKQARSTARRFLDLDFTNAAFTHGPEILGEGKVKIKNFLSNKGSN